MSSPPRIRRSHPAEDDPDASGGPPRPAPSADVLHVARRLGRGTEMAGLWMGPFLTAEERAYMEELDQRERAEAEGAAFDFLVRGSGPRRRRA
jgi:hypothetical protein